MAALSTVQTKALLRQGISAKQADAISAWMDAVLDALEAVGAKLDSDGGVTDTNYAAVIAAIIDD